jgi:hypothetical protein
MTLRLLSSVKKWKVKCFAVRFVSLCSDTYYRSSVWGWVRTTNWVVCVGNKVFFFLMQNPGYMVGMDVESCSSMWTCAGLRREPALPWERSPSLHFIALEYGGMDHKLKGVLNLPLLVCWQFVEFCTSFSFAILPRRWWCRDCKPVLGIVFSGYCGWRGELQLWAVPGQWHCKAAFETEGSPIHGYCYEQSSSWNYPTV